MSVPAYERLTVNLVERASRALELAAQITGDTKTDTVNRALQFYAFIEYEISQGAEFVLVKDGVSSKITFGEKDS